MKILNKKQIRELVNLLDKQFGFKQALEYVFIKNHKDYYITNKNIGKVGFNDLNIKRIGTFFGRVINNNFILSIEGSQGNVVEKLGCLGYMFPELYQTCIVGVNEGGALRCYEDSAGDPEK